MSMFHNWHVNKDTGTHHEKTGVGSSVVHTVVMGERGAHRTGCTGLVTTPWGMRMPLAHWYPL